MSKENDINEEEVLDMEVVVENVKMARKILKRRLYGLDIPSKCWLNFGLENQKRY